MKVYIYCHPESDKDLFNFKNEIQEKLLDNADQINMNGDVILIYVDQHTNFQSNEFKNLSQNGKNLIMITHDNRNRKLAPKTVMFQATYNLKSKKKFADLVGLLNKNTWEEIKISKSVRSKVAVAKKKEATLKEIRELEKKQKQLLENTKSELKQTELKLKMIAEKEKIELLNKLKKEEQKKQQKLHEALNKQEQLIKDTEKEKQKWETTNKLFENTPNLSIDEEGKECIVCGELVKDAVFLNCGHNCTCYECAQYHFQGADCPMCRQKIVQIVKIFS